jgi:hypothetical protein
MPSLGDESFRIVREFSYPIRLVFGICHTHGGDNGIQIHYETESGGLKSRHFWDDGENYKKIRFIDPKDGESRIVFQDIDTKTEGFWGESHQTFTVIKEILIRRDWQFKG